MSKRSANSKQDATDDPGSESTGSQASGQGLFASEFVRGANHEYSPSVGSQAVLVVDGNGAIVEVLQAPDFGDGAAPSALIGRSIDELWAGEPADRLAKEVRRAIRSRQVESTEFTTAADNSYHDFILIPKGPNRVMVVARDVSERQTAYTRMERLAYLDDATKLPNRQFLLEELNRCTNMLRLQEGRAAVLCLDISYPDGQDHSGDLKRHEAIFVELAARLTHELRGANAVDVDDYERYSVAARVEHNQFGVILPVIESGADAEGVAKRLIDTLQQPIKLAHHESSVIVRGGIALFPQDGTDAQTLYVNANAAMEDARSAQAIPYKLHSGTVRLRALQRQDLELELRVALDRDEFAVEFLPIVAADTREVLSVEALLRWPQDVFGPKSIQKVVSVAENTGLILPIGAWVLRKSCEALKEWHASGWPELRVSVNLSVQEFSLKDLPSRIATVLEENELDPRFLDVEITEYSLFRDAMKKYAMCKALKALGVGIIVDDYGTGACSFSHVARAPVDGIKIDDSFVVNAVADSTDRAACGAITAMARSLGKRVIAEGVETEDQAEVLVQQGCDALQGFITCRPTSTEGIKELLARGAPE